MGLEATCTASLGQARARGRALLETTELLFRSDELRARVPFAEIKSAAAEGDRLVIRWGGQTLALELGAEAAARWLDKIRRPPSRLDKLGVRPTSRAAVVGRLDDDFVAELSARAAAVVRGTPRGPVDLLFYAVDAPADIGRLPALAARLAPDGALWIVRPKGRSAAVAEQEVRTAARAAGLVDVKVVAFSAARTADKMVIPVTQRTAVKPARATARSPRPGPSTSTPPRSRPRPARG
jgi:hypothetical protein